MLGGRLKVARLLSALRCDIPSLPFYSILMLPYFLSFLASSSLHILIPSTPLLPYPLLLFPYPLAPPPLLPLLQFLVKPIPYSIFLLTIIATLRRYDDI
jgi:hypothetical protein